ncbi:MAG: hypothetical protein JNL82_05225 [Myxococcales bacterium]|nr:hypothetical protein [Myxococcales bacterium]
MLRVRWAVFGLLACGGGGGGDDGAGSTGSGGPVSFASSGEAASEPTGEGSGGGSGETGGSSSTTGLTGETASATTGDGESSTGGPAPSEDEVLMRAAIAGEVDPGDALATIAGRGGLPVITTSESFLFGCLCGPGAWNLSGDHNRWTDAPLQATGPLLWAEAEVAAADGSLYKFHETGGDVWIADPLGRRYGFDDFGRYSLVRASAAHLERWYAMAGEGLQPRDLQVWVPQGGRFSHALYVHDGQNLFDPEAIWGGWRLQDSVPPGVLVVGIDNTPARMDEYTHVPDSLQGQVLGGQGDQYADFVENTVRPRMEAAYGAAEVVGTMGSSLGGLIAYAIADRFPERYAMAISLSGTMGWGSIEQHNETMIERYAAAGHRAFALYLDSGGQGVCADADADGIEDDGDANDNYCENLQLKGELEAVGYVEGSDLWYVHDPAAEHSELFWADRVGVPMATFAGL